MLVGGQEVLEVLLRVLDLTLATDEMRLFFGRETRENRWSYYGVVHFGTICVQVNLQRIVILPTL
jgi:hypothetical protein